MLRTAALDGEWPSLDSALGLVGRGIAAAAATHSAAAAARARRMTHRDVIAPSGDGRRSFPRIRAAIRSTALEAGP